MSDEEFEHEIQQETECEDEAQQCRNTHKLCSELAGIAIEQAGDRARDAVPTSAIVTGAVGKQSNRKYAPQTIGAVDGDSSDGVVNLHYALNESAAEADKHASYEP